MVYVFKIKDEVIGIFDDCHELALAIWQHRDFLKLAGWIYNLDDIVDYIEDTPLDFNNVMEGGSITDYVLNIDYETYRFPSLTAQYAKKLEEENKAWRKEHLGL